MQDGKTTKQVFCRSPHPPALVVHLVAAQVEVRVGEHARRLAHQAPQEAVAAAAATAEPE